MPYPSWYSNASGQWAINYFGNAAGLANYTIQNGDKLYLTQYQLSGSKGGVVLNFTDGSNSSWSVKDKEGYYLNDDQTQANTHFRTIDLSSLAGKIISKVGLDQETDTANGSWAMFYEQISLVSLDGTVHPIYTGQTTSPITSSLQSGGETGIGSHIDVNRGKATSPTQTTTYYVADHLGSSRLIASGNGYPIWSGVFLPYGQEWNPQITMNHYKFTGDEHDAESNLDHTWFRQYEGTQGRWLSPDPAGMAAVDSTNPQSLNMYEYVLSNPMSLLDPDGLDCLFSNSGKWYSNSSYDEETCYSYGGYWVGGSAVAYTINPDGTLTFLYKDSNGNPASSTTSGDNVTVSGPPVSSDSFLPGVNFIDPNSFGLPSAGGGKQTNGNATIGPVGTITNGTPKVQYCHEQANKAFLANLIPGGDILFQHGFTPEAAAAAGLDVAGDAAREYAGEKIINTAANGATWLGTLRKAAGLTAKDARMAGRFVGVAGTSYTIYKALKASQKEWDYCME